MPDRRIPSELMHQRWVHSHEEDTETEMVFRPATYSFPRSRGRRSLELRAGGAVIEGGPGPTDRREESQGTWRLAEDGTLALYRPDASTPHRVLKIVFVTPDRLVVSKRP